MSREKQNLKIEEILESMDTTLLYLRDFLRNYCSGKISGKIDTVRSKIRSLQNIIKLLSSDKVEGIPIALVDEYLSIYIQELGIMFEADKTIDFNELIKRFKEYFKIKYPVAKVKILSDINMIIASIKTLIRDLDKEILELEKITREFEEASIQK